MENGYIQTLRLELLPLPLEACRLICNSGDNEIVDVLGFSVESVHLLRLRPVACRRVIQLQNDPSELPWLLHFVVLRDQQRVIGHIGFHEPPDKSGTVEIGYTILESFRRQGFALEAAIGMSAWARLQPGAQILRASISPSNVPSLRLAARLGLVEVGSQIDEIDGEELVFEGPLA